MNGSGSHRTGTVQPLPRNIGERDDYGTALIAGQYV